MIPELDLRTAMFEWLADQVARRGRTLSHELLARGFPFRGERVPLWSQSGIWKPARCEAPLTIMTSGDGPYEDRQTPDGRLLYHYRGDDPDHYHNRAMRVARETCATTCCARRTGRCCCTGSRACTWPR